MKFSSFVSIVVVWSIVKFRFFRWNVRNACYRLVCDLVFPVQAACHSSIDKIGKQMVVNSCAQINAIDNYKMQNICILYLIWVWNPWCECEWKISIKWYTLSEIIPDDRFRGFRVEKPINITPPNIIKWTDHLNFVCKIQKANQ